MTAALLPYALLLTGLLLLAPLSGKRDWLTYALTLVLLAWTLLESCWSIAQTLRDGLAAYPYPFLVMGSFHNPAPFGAFHAIGLVTAAASLVRFRKEKDLFSRLLYYLSLAVLIPGGIMLIASRSRAAWIGLMVSLAVLLLRETGLRTRIRKRRIFAVSAVIVLLMAGAGLFLMKKDSAIGRFHIWNMECRVIGTHPWTGVGFSRIFKAYGDAQADYFQQAERPAAIVRTAGSPVYAFNEYLKFGMAWGIGGLLLSAAVAAWVVWRLFRKRSLLAYGALVYVLFAFASFPLSVVQLKLVGTVFLALALAPENKPRGGWLPAIWGMAFIACAVAAYLAYPAEKLRRSTEREWRASLLSAKETDNLADRLQPFYDCLKENPVFLYQYGEALRQAGAFEESNRILQQGADCSCDPVFHSTMAQNHLALGHFDKAEQELWTAHGLIPCRISPLLALMRLYADTGRIDAAIETGRTIRKMPVYESHPDMERLHGEAMALLSELEIAANSVSLP